MKINILFKVPGVQNTAVVTSVETMDEAIQLADDAGEDKYNLLRLLTIDTDKDSEFVLRQLLDSHVQETADGRKSTLEMLASQIFMAGFIAGRRY